MATLCVQVERRVVTQLAMAHERQLIKEGNVIRVTVTNPDYLLTKLDNDLDSDADEEQAMEEQGLKIQVQEEGSKDAFRDISFDSGENPFTIEFKWFAVTVRSCDSAFWQVVLMRIRSVLLLLSALDFLIYFFETCLVPLVSGAYTLFQMISQTVWNI